MDELRQDAIRKIARALDVPEELLGVPVQGVYSTGWCAPSQTLLDMWTPDPNAPRIPEDCGGPHVLLRNSVADNQCGCSHCGDGVRRWLECDDCLFIVNDDGGQDFEDLWEAAEWA